VALLPATRRGYWHALNRSRPYGPLSGAAKYPAGARPSKCYYYYYDQDARQILPDSAVETFPENREQMSVKLPSTPSRTHSCPWTMSVQESHEVTDAKRRLSTGGKVDHPLKGRTKGWLRCSPAQMPPAALESLKSATATSVTRQDDHERPQPSCTQPLRSVHRIENAPVLPYFPVLNPPAPRRWNVRINRRVADLIF
jgi:hypothetical protein